MSNKDSCGLREAEGSYRVHDIAVTSPNQLAGDGTPDYQLPPRDNSWLGQPGGARGVDEDGQVGQTRLRTVRVGSADGLVGENLGLNVRRQSEEAHIRKLVADLLGNLPGDIRVDDAQATRSDAQALDERVASQVVVDESRLRTNAPEPPPQKDKGRRVLKVHGDNILGLDAHFCAQPVAVPQDDVVGLGVRVTPALEDEHGPAGSARVRRHGLDQVEEVQPVGILAVVHPRDARERAVDQEEIVPRRRPRVEVGDGGCEGWRRDGERDCEALDHDERRRRQRVQTRHDVVSMVDTRYCCC